MLEVTSPEENPAREERRPVLYTFRALRKQARLGNLWVTGGSAQGLSEESVELATGGVKRALLVFPAVMD